MPDSAVSYWVPCRVSATVKLTEPAWVSDFEVVS